MKYTTFINKFFNKKVLGGGLFVLSIVALILTVHTIDKPHLYTSSAYSNLIPSSVGRMKMHRPLHSLKRITASQLSLKTKFSPLATQFAGYSPDDIKRAYNLPSTGGNGTIAIIDFFDTPSAEHDLNAFSSTYNLPACTTANGCFQVVYPSGKPPLPTDTASQFETDLDIEWAHAIAPNAKILLVETLSDQIADVIPVVDFVRNQPNISAISMSFGTDEFADEINMESFFNSTSGGTFFAAAGDTGHGAFWPASSPHVIAVGGTSLTINGTSVVESAWNQSGGGISGFFAEPDYQTSFPITSAQGKRAIPDVSADGDPSTGVVMYGPDGNWWIFGGTSLSTPIWAGISALGSTPLTNTLLYQNAKNNYARYYRDIVNGSNGTCTIFCTAQNNYDYITGLGSPIAMPLSLGSSLTPTSPTATPTQIPTPSLSPTLTLSPTLIPTPTGTNFSVTVGLHGIAHGGDNVNPNATGNAHVMHPTRQLTITAKNTQDNQTQQFQGSITLDNVSGLFGGFINLATLTTGDYILTFKTDEFLTSTLKQSVHVVQGQTVQVPTVFLVNGDINNDNQLDVLDYSAFIKCFGSKQFSSSCLYPTTPTSVGADLDDSGSVDAANYNVFIREFSAQP